MLFIGKHFGLEGQNIPEFLPGVLGLCLRHRLEIERHLANLITTLRSIEALGNLPFFFGAYQIAVAGF